MVIKNAEAMIVKIDKPFTETNKIRNFGEDYYVLDQPLSIIYSKKNETVLVKLTTDEGVVGWGEALAPTNPEVVFELLKGALLPAVIGRDALENEPVRTFLYNMYRVRGYECGFLQDAMAAIDIALWDIKGKVYHQPCWKIMGGASHSKIPVYMSQNRGKIVKDRIDDIRQRVSEGYRAYKLHSVGDSWLDAYHVLAEVRKEFSPDQLKLMHDGKWNYSLAEAKAFGKQLDDLSIEFLECPLAPEDLKGHIILANSMKTQLALGESVRGLECFRRWIDSGAIGLLQPDVGRIGITEYLKAATLAEAQHISTGPHLSVHQSVGIMASVHLAIAVSSTAWFEYQPAAMQTARNFSGFDLKMEDGYILKPSEIGLGVDIQETLLQKHVTQNIRVS